jgi:hypothetical protein
VARDRPGFWISALESSGYSVLRMSGIRILLVEDSRADSFREKGGFDGLELRHFSSWAIERRNRVRSGA